MDDIQLSSVNFEHGMLLTPDHLLGLERYFDSALLWTIRYAADVNGLVGGGPRTPEAERGAVRNDPVVTVTNDEEHVDVAVTQCRGLSASGCIIDIDADHALTRRFAKDELDGVLVANVYVVCSPHDKEALDGGVDQWNPQMRTERRIRYRLSLQVQPHQQPNSLIVGRISKAQFGGAYEKDAGFIPPCATMSSYSELAAGWRRIVEETGQMLERYVELYRAMQEFLILFKERGIETALDEEALALTGRTVVALQSCYYEIVDPVQPPRRFFGHLRRFFHSAAIYLDLSPQVQGYFEMLRDTGESELVTLLDGQKRTAKAGFQVRLSDDLAREVRNSLQVLADLRRLERALEGKYLDFRINRSLESMNFVFDRGGKVLYRLASKPARTQGAGSDMIITFAQLRLEGRDKYRIILVGEQNAVFDPGTRIAIELHINEGTGFRRQPVLLSAESKLSDQCNFEFDFEAPDVPTISDLRVTVAAHFPIRTALLYVRQRFYGGFESSERTSARELTSSMPERPGASANDEEPPYWGRDYDRPRAPAADEAAVRTRVSQVDQENIHAEAGKPPWEVQRRSERVRAPESPPAVPPRRRRLE